jgi:putative tricarboxylic transport membrane protein
VGRSARAGRGAGGHRRQLRDLLRWRRGSDRAARQPGGGGHLENGDLRILATASAEPLEVAPDAPTIADAGFPDSALVNWRGVFAPPGISEDDLANLDALFADLVESEAWQEILTTNGWSDEYLDSEEFTTQLEEEQTNTEQLLKDLGLV